jgi:hypothetical protein
MGHHDNVEQEALVWYANHDNPYYILRTSGAVMIGIAVTMCTIAICASVINAGPGSPILLAIFASLVPVAGCLALWEWLVDRHAVVKISLAPADRPSRVMLRRVDRTTDSYPISELSLVKVTHFEGGRPCTIMRLHIGGRIARTRSGPAALPTGWVESLATAAVPVHIDTRNND